MMQSVFVGACARSGTTFLGSMLGTHSRCLATPESKFNVEIYLESARHSSAIDLVAAFHKIRQRSDFVTWGLDANTIARSEALSTVKALPDYPALLHWLVRQYATSVGRPAPDLWIDHTPFNIFYAPVLFSLYPDAKMIHLIRDGRSVASSVMKLDWGPNTANAAAYWWINRVAHGLAAESCFGPERVRRVRYEDLVMEPEATLQSLCSFLGLEFEPKMVTGTGFRLPKRIAGIHPHVGSVPNVKRIQAWQSELAPRQIEIFESIAGQFLSSLGYELQYGAYARPVSTWEMLGLGMRELYAEKIGNRLHRRTPAKREDASVSSRPVTVS